MGELGEKDGSPTTLKLVPPYMSKDSSLLLELTYYGYLAAAGRGVLQVAAGSVLCRGAV